MFVFLGRPDEITVRLLESSINEPTADGWMLDPNKSSAAPEFGVDAGVIAPVVDKSAPVLFSSMDLLLAAKSFIAAKKSALVIVFVLRNCSASGP